MNCYGSLYTNLLYRIIFLAGGTPRGRSSLAGRPVHRYAGQKHKSRPNNGIFKEMVE